MKKMLKSAAVCLVAYAAIVLVGYAATMLGRRPPVTPIGGELVVPDVPETPTTPDKVKRGLVLFLK